jgi:UDP:flavonoid glycosyltransferase YjiC (YdhE family)
VRAGVPAVVVPFHGDQPFWGSRVRQLGTGPAPIPRRKLTAKRLAAAIEVATTDAAMRQRAAEIGRLVRADAGAIRAATLIAGACRA